MTHEALSVALLWTCLFLFLLRVLGQVYVALYHPRWLPEMAQWYSGLLPYPLLLPTQVLILMWTTIVAYDFTRRQGAFFVSDPGKARVLLVLSIVYALGMLVRYVVRMVRRPDQRWFGGCIPIFLHVVLALFMFLCATFPAP